MRTIFVLLVTIAAYSQVSAEYLVFYENGKAGLRDDAGKVIIPAAFDALGWSDGSFSVTNQVTGYRQTGKWGLINLKKEFVTKAEFESVTTVGGDRIVASKHINPYTVKFGCVDLNGKVTVPFTYDGITIHGLRAIVFVKNGTKYEHGLIDLNDKTILPMRYRDIQPIGTLRFAIQNFERRTALFSEEGAQLTGFEIDSISSFRRGYAIVYQHLQMGLIDREGTMVVAPTLRDLRFSEQSIEGKTNDSWKILDSNNHEVKSIEADELIVDGSQYRLSQSGRFGTATETLDVRIPISFEKLEPFKGNHAIAKRERKFGVVSIQGKETIPFEFDSLFLEGSFVRGMKHVLGENQWALYDTFNVKKTARAYETMLPYNGRFFKVQHRGYWGAVDRYGKEILTCVYDSIGNHHYEAIAVKFKGLYGIIGPGERWLLMPQRYPVTVLDDEHYLERQDTIQFLRHINGEVIYFTSNPIRWANGLLEETTPDHTIRFISLAGISSAQALAPSLPGTEEVFEESEGLRGIRRDGQYGFVDGRNRLRIANRYEAIGKFSEGRARVKLLGRWGYISKDDQVIINPNFDEASDFMNGLAIVTRSGKTGVIDIQGNLLLPLRYDSVQRVNDLFLLSVGNQKGVSDLKGNVLIEPRFDHLQLVPNGLVIVRSDNKWGVLTTDGMPVIPMVYQFMKYNPATNQFLANQKGEWKRLLGLR